MCQEEHICTRANRHHTSLMMPVRPSSFLLISFLIWLLLIVRLSYFWLWFTYQDKLCALTWYRLNSILYAQCIPSYNRHRRNFVHCINKVHGRHSSILQNKNYILYLTKIIFLSIYVNHSSVTFLGVNFFLIEDPGKRILCVHRAESKNLCTVIISGFNLEPL